MGELFDGSVETIAYPIQKTYSRMSVFDYSIALYDVECNIIHGKRVEKINSFFVFFTVYDNCQACFNLLESNSLI